jgi:hypothetical protein
MRAGFRLLLAVASLAYCNTAACALLQSLEFKPETLIQEDSPDNMRQLACELAAMLARA